MLKEVEHKVVCVFSWFSTIYFKANPKKSHFFLTSNEQVNLYLGELITKSSKSEKLLRIKKLLCINTDNFFTFIEHFSKLCKKGKPKIISHCTYFKLSD